MRWTCPLPVLSVRHLPNQGLGNEAHKKQEAEMSYTYKHAAIHFDGNRWVAQYDGGFATGGTSEAVEAIIDRSPAPAAPSERSIYCSIGSRQFKLA